MAVTHFVWDELSDNVLTEVDDSGTTTAEYTNEPILYGELISQRRDSTDSYFHFDAQRSTRQLTSDNETETDSYSYSAFGETISETGSTENPFRYNGAVGYYTDQETGELYVRRRWYWPRLGRWLSMDPLMFIDGPNNFSYVRNNPIGLSDPSGQIRYFVYDLGFVDRSKANGICYDYEYVQRQDLSYIAWNGLPKYEAISRDEAGNDTTITGVWLQNIRAFIACEACETHRPLISSVQFWEWWSLEPKTDPRIGAYKIFGETEFRYYGTDEHILASTAFEQPVCTCKFQVRVRSYMGVVKDAATHRRLWGSDVRTWDQNWGILERPKPQVPDWFKKSNRWVDPKGTGRYLTRPVPNNHIWGYEVVCAAGKCEINNKFGYVEGI